MENKNNQPSDWQNAEANEIQNPLNDLDISSLLFSKADIRDDDEDEEEVEEETDTDWGNVDPLSNPGRMPSPNDPSGPGSAV